MTGGEISAEARGEAGFDYDDLIPEWREEVDKLRATKKGRVALSDPALQRHIWINSREIDMEQTKIDNGVTSFEDLSWAELENLYYINSSVLDMAGRVSVLEVVRQGVEYNLENRPVDLEKIPLKRRWLASVLEEISTFDNAGCISDSAIRALEINDEISTSDLSKLVQRPERLHAKFSIFDIGLRSLFHSPHISADHEGVRRLPESAQTELINGIQLHYFRFLGKSASILKVLPPNSSDGAIGELMVKGRLTDRTIDDGSYSFIEASQGTLRQDTTINSSGLPDIVRMSFDLTVKNHRTKNIVRVEVKKRIVNNGDEKTRVVHKRNGDKLEIEEKNYLPSIEVVRFRLGRNREEYFAKVEQYCAGREAELSDVTPTRKQKDALYEFRSKIDPELDKKVFAKLAA